MNFVVMDKENYVEYDVYWVKNDKNGYPHFLIFNYYGRNEWDWISAKRFVESN